MLKRNNSEAKLLHRVDGVSSLTLTNPLHRIVVQPSSGQKEMLLKPNQRTKKAVEKEKERKKGVRNTQLNASK